MSKVKTRKILRIFRICLYIIAFIYLLIKEPNANYSFIICPSKSMFNFDCYLCGMTRAFIAMFHLKFMDAINYNPLIVIFYPLLILLAIQDAFIILKDFIMKKETNSFIEFLVRKV